MTEIPAGYVTIIEKLYERLPYITEDIVDCDRRGDPEIGDLFRDTADQLGRHLIALGYLYTRLGRHS